MSPGIKRRFCPEQLSTRVLHNMDILRPYFPRIPASSTLECARWVQEFCPEVVRHFRDFPLFTASTFNVSYSVSETSYAVKGACLVRIARDLAASAGSTGYLYAGSHLGALLHGGPIPWDDDFDMVFPLEVKSRLLKQCLELASKGPPVTCHEHENAIKMFIVNEPQRRDRDDGLPWNSPYVDMFFFRIVGSEVVEVTPEGTTFRNASFPDKRYQVSKFFPAQAYYFSGFHIFGPNKVIAQERYDTSVCKLPMHNHNLEIPVVGLETTSLDCCELKLHFPFLRGNHLSNNRNTLELHDFKDHSLRHLIPLELRQKYRASLDEEGQRLTALVPSLDDTELVNSINRAGCGVVSRLRVGVINMERGKYWLYYAQLLEAKQLDIVILNEMDIGMARSNQQHTARLFAQKLNMNYAWGLEFVELTRGTLDEQIETRNLYDFNGLHGNAVLSRCHFLETKIFRDPIGDYFSSSESPVNAGGFEKRLGGRMALMARLKIGSGSLTVGSLHKVSSKETLTGIANYTRKNPEARIILGGDQDDTPCDTNNLTRLNSESTWEASCSSSGEHVGDMICSNLAIRAAVETHRPCAESSGSRIRLGDHAFLVAELIY